MPTDPAPSTPLWTAAARSLAPRAVGRDGADLAADGLARVSLRPTALDAAASEGLASIAVVRRREEHGRWTLTLPLVALAERAGHCAASALLLGAWESACGADPPPRLAGVLNVTPDSFSDGGELTTTEAVVARGRAMVAAGAELLDVGGESTRPGAEPVGVDVECERVVPPIAALAAAGLGPISIDTRRSAVAAAALDAGATVVNDVEAGCRDRAMLPLIAERGCGYIAMHMRGDPRTMQQAPAYDDVVGEVAEFLRERLAACTAAGIDPRRVWLDPGIGFGKTLEHNLALLAATRELRSLGRPLFVGVSRKRFIGVLTEEPDAAKRSHGTAGAVAACVAGGAEWLRVHDVAAMRAAVRVAAAVRDRRPS